MALNAEDELSIQRLVAIYSDAVTCRDPDAAAAVFTEDAVLSAFGGPDVSGRTAIRDALAGRSRRATGDANRDEPPEPGFSMQFTRMIAVDMDGSDAVGRSYYFEMSRGPDRDSAGRFSTGINEDRYALTPEGWRIARRRIMRTYVGDASLPGKTTAIAVPAWPGGPKR